MLLNLLNVTIVFGIGLIIANLIAVVLTRKWQWFVGSTIIELLVIMLFLYVSLPAKNLSTLLAVNLFLGFAASVLNLMRLSVGDSLAGMLESLLNRDNQKQGAHKHTPSGFAKKYIVVTVLFVLIGIGLVAVQSVTRVTSINNVYDTLPSKTKNKSELLTSARDMPIAIAPDTAKRKMQQKFSVIPNSNMYSLGGITAQVYQGKYVYVATVEFNGFWRWLKNRDVPGYFVISATDVDAQPEFIQKPLKYSPSAYLNYDAARRIYAAFPTYASTGALNLELDEHGNPYYIQTLYKEYGVSGRMHFNEFKTAVLNATTGQVKLYAANKAPKFVDAPITSAAATDMNEYFGRYGKGWWNQTSFGAKRGVKIPTNNGIYEGGKLTPLLDTKGQLMYFTDFTSGNSEQDSALGYSLINARTGKLTYYRDANSGIMDSDGAISIADKIYPEKKWEAKMPILYNIDGVPTWIISLLDSKGIFKKYVYINAIDNDIVIDGDSAQEALDGYRNELATKGSNNRSTDPTQMKEITGKVYRTATVSDTKQTIVSFVLAGRPTVFSVNIANAPDALFLQTGDEVSFKADVLDDAKVAVIDTMAIKNFNK